MKAVYLTIFAYALTALGSALPKGQFIFDGGPGKSFIQQHGITYELVQHSHFTDHQLRITKPSLCDASVKQYSGYLDVTDSKHLFFWFFEARHSPETAPLILWLNGGPGCSSSAGLMFELGPCSIADGGAKTVSNPYSWNNVANIIFLDQPIEVGFSYADDGSRVGDSDLAAKDVYAFLELFLTRFPEYSALPFHLAAESYGGTYAPHIASVIYQENQKTPALNDLVTINLRSVIIGNGLTDSATQLPSIPDYLCEGPYPLFDDPEGPQCQSLRSQASTCHTLVQGCYLVNSRLVCTPAALYCSRLYAPMHESDRNPYDARRMCDAEKNGPLCYEQLSWIETYMNSPEVKAALGADPERKFQSCNMAVTQAFLMSGDSVRNTAKLVPELVNNGIRLLVYAGVADMACNYMGQERWLEVLDTQFLDEFLEAPTEKWFISDGDQLAGTVRSAGGDGSRAGNVTLVTVLEAGHMVPYDQPLAALDMITRWTQDISLAWQE